MSLIPPTLCSSQYETQIESGQGLQSMQNQSMQDQSMAVNNLLKKYTDEIVTSLEMDIANIIQDREYYLGEVINQSLSFEEASLTPPQADLYNVLTKSVIASFEMKNGKENLDIVTIAAKDQLTRKVRSYAEAIDKNVHGHVLCIRNENK